MTCSFVTQMFFVQQKGLVGKYKMLVCCLDLNHSGNYSICMYGLKEDVLTNLLILLQLLFNQTIGGWKSNHQIVFVTKTKYVLVKLRSDP